MAKQQSKATKQNRSRIMVFFAFVCLLFFLLAVRLGVLQILQGEDLALKAVKQQTSDSLVTATRGQIVDRNFNQLAISSTKYTVWVRTSEIRSNGKDDEEVEANKLLETKRILEYLNLDEDEVYETLSSEKALIRLAKGLEAEEVEGLREAHLKGLEIVENSSRSYPLGAFLSQVIGFTNDDNVGTTGLELQYNSQLSGLDGRWITNKDNHKNSLAYGVNKYYAAEDGATLQLTIDEYIQHVVMQKIAECKETTRAERVMCLMMDPKTAEILAMAQTDEFDPNTPRDGVDEESQEYLSSASDEEKVRYWNKLWRCFCICDTYEPGSTFKLITTSLALETGSAYMGETFQCNSGIRIADRFLKCWDYPRSHGTETLQQAVENSCNPVMAQLSQRIGINAFYDGLDAFGLTEKTGVDFPGEASNILQKKGNAGPVGLATMSYGQGIAVTPISLVTAISSLANGGYLMQPHIVKGIYDASGNLVEACEPSIKSRSVSRQTADDVLSIMEMVVSEGGGGKAKVAGYRIGGKTGTASKPIPGGYSDTDVYASFIGVAPIDDPRFVILVIVDTPKGVLYGSSTAAPCAKEIMEEVLTYMGVEPNFTSAEKKALSSKKATVPNVIGKHVADAIGVLGGRELSFSLSPEVEAFEELVVVDQYPRAGASIDKGGEVTLYYEVVEGANDNAELGED